MIDQFSYYVTLTFSEKLMYNRLYNFLEKKKKLYFHSNLVFDRNILPLMFWLVSQIILHMRFTKVTVLVKSLQTLKRHLIQSIIMFYSKKQEYYGFRNFKYMASFEAVCFNKWLQIKSKCSQMCGASRFHTGMSFISKYSKEYHFASDTNLLYIHSCVNSINKQVNYDSKIFSNLLKTNKNTLNVGKTELVLSTSPKK